MDTIKFSFNKKCVPIQIEWQIQEDMIFRKAQETTKLEGSVSMQMNKRESLDVKPWKAKICLRTIRILWENLNISKSEKNSQDKKKHNLRDREEEQEALREQMKENRKQQVREKIRERVIVRKGPTSYGYLNSQCGLFSVELSRWREALTILHLKKEKKNSSSQILYLCQKKNLKIYIIFIV